MKCLHTNMRMQNKCGLLRDNIPCRGVECPWYLSRDMRLESLVKAARSYRKNHPERPLSDIIPEKWVNEVEQSLTTDI